MDPEPLEILPEDWSSALCVVAHPDDLEFGAAAAIARWTGQGKSIVYCMVTSGEAGIDGMHPDESRRSVRPSRSSRRGSWAWIVEFLGLPDGVVEYGVPLRRVIADVVRRNRPEIVITGNFRDTFGGRNLNQADHIAVGKAVLDAVRDAGNRWIFPEQLVDGLEPWGASARSGRRTPPSPRTGWTPPTRSRPGSTRSGRTRRTSRASAGRTGTPRSSWRASPGHRSPGGAAFGAAFEVFPLGWGD